MRIYTGQVLDKMLHLFLSLRERRISLANSVSLGNPVRDIRIVSPSPTPLPKGEGFKALPQKYWTIYTLIVLVLFTQNAFAAHINCKDFDEDNDKYEESMQALPDIAKIPEIRWDRNHENAVTNICEGSSQATAEVNEMVNNGSLSAADAEAIAHALGKHYHAPPRNAKGLLYESINRKALDLGVGDANAANIATEYVKNPKGDLASQLDAASAGDKSALDKLHQKYPEPGN